MLLARYSSRRRWYRPYVTWKASKLTRTAMMLNSTAAAKVGLSPIIPYTMRAKTRAMETLKGREALSLAR